MLKSTVRNTMITNGIAVILLTAILLPLFIIVSAEANYPEKPIKVIVGYKPGGSSDTDVRMIAKYAKAYFGTQIVVENVPGAGGSIGWRKVAMAEPDGYTLGWVSVPSIMIMQEMRKTGYQMDDFAAVLSFMAEPRTLTVNPNCGKAITTIDDFIAYARKNPGDITVGTGGVGTAAWTTVIAFEQALAIDLTVVPYGGGAEILAALRGGHVDAMTIAPGGGLASGVEDGVMIPIIQFVKQPSKYLDSSLPVAEDMGIDIGMSPAIRGLIAPAGIPDNIISFVHDQFVKIMEDPDFIKDLKTRGAELAYMNTEEFKNHLQKEAANIKQLISEFKEKGILEN